MAPRELVKLGYAQRGKKKRLDFILLPRFYFISWQLIMSFAGDQMSNR